MSNEDVTVHRFKFSDWTPSPIRSLAVDKFSGLVAIGREDGDIEIVNPAESWYTQARVCGKEGFGLRGLAFSPLNADAGRLFGVSLCGFVFEVDFASLTLKNIRDSYGGGVWAIASNPRGPTMALGCEDKTVKLFSYGNSSSLEYEKTFPSTGSRVLCVAFNPTLPQVLAGCADGTIRCYDEVTSSNIFRLTGDVKKGMKMSACIWSLIVLDDESTTIVSGDGQGKLQFWDGKSGDMTSSVHRHSAAIQCIVATGDQDTIFASGIDSRVICVQRIRQKTSDVAMVDRSDTSPPLLSDRWVYTSAHRPHSHDVYALATASASQLGSRHDSITNTRQSTEVFNTLISGGLDCKLCLYSTSDFAGCRPSWILPIPCSGIASASFGVEHENVVSIKHRTHVDLWKLSLSKSHDENICDNSCRIQLKSSAEGNENSDGFDDGLLGRDHIHSTVVSPNGDFVVVTGGSLHATSSNLRIFHIAGENRASDSSSIAQVCRVKLDRAVEEATDSEFVTCQAVAFSSNGRSLALSTTAVSASIGSSSIVSILLLNIPDISENPNGKVALHHTFHHSKITAMKDVSAGMSSTLEGFLEKSIKSLCFSADDRWLAVSSSSKRLYIYDIDRLSLHWAVPCFSAPVTCVAFHPTSPNSLLTTTTSSTSPFLIFDVMKKELSNWSQENTDIIPNWKSVIKSKNYGPIQNITFDPSCSSAFMLFGQGFSIYVDLNLPILTALPTDSKFDNDTVNSKCDYVHKGLVSVLMRSSDEKGIEDSMSKKVSNRKKRKLSVSGVKNDINEGESISSRNFSVLKAYRSLVLITLLNDKEMVVIENPWVRVLENLPSTLSRKRFGT